MSDAKTSKLPIWLVVSLIVNALLIGVLIGGGLGQRKAGPPPGGPGGSEQALIRGIERSLPDDQRQIVRRAFRQAFVESREQRIAVRDARQRLARLLAAETYDADAVRESFQKLREADAAMRAQMQDVLAEQFGTLTAEQRRAILEDLNRRSRRRGGPEDGRRGPPPPRPSD
ncbi:MAG: periplasmic heavy metal sensor [Hyphomonas sp.]|nr:periplasmic heavy metal sensor [Hyphomonas sp.]